MGRSGLTGLVVVMLAGTGCIASKPYVHTELQKSEARTQGHLQSVDARLDAIEHELSTMSTRVGTLDADTHRVQAMVEETAKQTDQALGLAVEASTKAEAASRDAAQRASSLPSTPPREPVARAPDIVIVRFGFAQWRLDNPARLALLNLVKRLQESPALTVRLDGHSDSVGSPSQNLEVSVRRAKEVRRFLVGNGVPRNRIEIRAIGEARPIASNRSATGRDQNRRVAITLLSSAASTGSSDGRRGP